MAEAQLGERFDSVAFLVKTRCEAERRGEGQPEGSGLQRRRRGSELLQDPAGTGGMRKPDALEPDFVGAFGVHP
ncbi:hypothetical protein D3C87_2135870 [compost metagenome]